MIVVEPHSQILVLVVVDAARGARDDGVARGEVATDDGGDERHSRPRDHRVHEQHTIGFT